MDEAAGEEDSPDGAPETRAAEIQELRDELDAFKASVEDRTLHRDEIEADLKQYVQRRLRRGHARGWGPYLVLLYGTVMTLGAFYYLTGGWAVLAMIVIWLSTLGLYVVMVLAGIGINTLSLPSKALSILRNWRS